MSDPILAIENLVIEAGGTRVVDELSLSISPGEVHGLVGESGSGKSLTAASIVGLLPLGPKVTGGEISFSGRSLLAADDDELRLVRGSKIGFVFQDPSSSLNPTKRIWPQVAESPMIHKGIPAKQGRALATDLLGKVGVPSPEMRSGSYPHQLSGGMRQRAAIAAALSSEPRLLIADEPTTALDVTVQAQILDLLDDKVRTHHLAVLLITHDLGVAARLCDSLTILYRGRVLESGPAEAVFGNPQSPYTRMLLSAVPTLDDTASGSETSGDRGLSRVPQVGPTGCRFSARCEFWRDACSADEPTLTIRASGQLARCFATDQEGWV